MLDMARRIKKIRSYDILDTPPEQPFDDIALLITRLCDVPIGLVSFADKDRHWYKARVGMAAKEIPSNYAVCELALSGPDEFLVIDDLSLDPRTRDNPIVVGEPHLRFYASVRLKTMDGVAIGTLCAVDYAPRPGGLSHSQKQGLSALARHTMALLWFRSSLASESGVGPSQVTN